MVGASLPRRTAVQQHRPIQRRVKVKSRPRIGLTGELDFKIEPQHAIDFAGGGMPPVLSTPNLIGFLERTARETMAGCLDADERSVGSEIELKHLAPTPVGHTVHCTARVIHVADREVTFQIEARDDHELIARGLHKRAIIRVDRFAQRVREKSV
jgi:fluoroacetyl-CoA thioesterase